MSHRQSIKKLLLGNMLLLIALVFGILVSGFTSNQVRTRQMKTIRDNDEAIQGLANLLSTYEDSYQQWMREGTTTSLSNFQDCSDSIVKAINASQSLFEATNEMLLYSRTISQISQALSKLVSEQLVGHRNEKGSFDVFQLVGFGFSQLLSQGNALTSAYIQYSGNRFSQISLMFQRYSRIHATLQLFFTLVILIPMLCLSIDLIQRLKKIDEASESLAQGKWDTDDLQLSRYEEFGNVADAFNHMKKEIRKNINAMEKALEVQKELAEQKQLVQETRFRMLQAQINPHFLFNTLNMIVHSIQTDKKEKATKLVLSTSNLLRQAIDLQDGEIGLQQELQLLDNYITIQKERTEGRITFMLDVFDCPNVTIPPFTLQPLVENAITHGLRDRTQGGLIEIQVFEDEAHGVFIIIQDNGVGFDVRILNPSSPRQNTFHGLLDTIERLKTHHSNPDIITISSSSKGTTIKMHLPGASS